jgi:hypothetical protein
VGVGVESSVPAGEPVELIDGDCVGVYDGVSDCEAVADADSDAVPDALEVSDGEFDGVTELDTGDHEAVAEAVLVRDGLLVATGLLVTRIDAVPVRLPVADRVAVLVAAFVTAAVALLLLVTLSEAV